MEGGSEDVKDKEGMTTFDKQRCRDHLTVKHEFPKNDLQENAIESVNMGSFNDIATDGVASKSGNNNQTWPEGLFERNLA